MFILQIIASIGGPGGVFDFRPRPAPAAPILAVNPSQTNYNRVLLIDPYQCSRCGGGSQRRTEGFRLNLSGYDPDLSTLLRPPKPIDPQILERLLRK